MKILYITNSINASGGLERVLALKGNYLALKSEHTVHIVTMNNGHENPFYKFNKHIKFYDIKVKNTVTYILDYKRKIQRLLKTIKPDVISVCDDGIKGLCFPLLIKTNCPVIYERHAALKLTIGSGKNALLKKLIIQKSIKKFNAFVVLTEGNKKDWPQVNCTVIPNPSPYKELKNKSTLNESEQLVVAVGSQDYNKGYDRLIEIWKIVNKACKNWRLEIYGKKKEDLNLQEKVNELRLNSSIKFNEPTDCIEAIYKKSSIYVMTSRSEGFGMVLIEAMTYGVPCIAFNCPHGPADIIEHNKNGILVENDDIDSFAKAIIKLINNKDVRQNFALNAMNSVKKYDIENIMPKWNNLFTKLT